MTQPTSDRPVWFTIVRTEQLSGSYGIFGQHILVALPCILSDLDQLYTRYAQFMIETPGVQIALFTREPKNTPITAHRKAHGDDLPPLPDGQYWQQHTNAEGERFYISAPREEPLTVADDPPLYDDWDSSQPY